MNTIKDTESNFNIEYREKLNDGYIAILVHYDLRQKYLTSSLRSISYFNDKTKKAFLLTCDSEKKDVKDYYSLIKLMFVTFQAEYIATISKE